MSELQEVQKAGARVIEDVMEAHKQGQLTEHVVLGFRLSTVAHMMVLAHQPGALKIAREYAEAVGLNFDQLDEQVEARIYERVQIDRLEAGVTDA